MPGMDGDVAPGHLLAVLHACHHARLYCCHEPGLRLEQEGGCIGGEKVILLSASAWGFITVTTPLLAHLGSGHLAFVTFSRILTGLLQGVYFPALTSLLSQRVQESERAFTYSTVGAGSQVGTLVTGGIGSVLLDRCGWQSVFYFSGGLTLLWAYYVYKYLLDEKDLVLALGVLAQGLPVTRPSKVPWRQLFRKTSVWLQSHHGAQVHAGHGPWPVKHFCPVSGSHHKLPQVYDLCISVHWLPDFQPQWYFSQHSGPGPILRWLPVWCSQHCRGLGRCGRRVSRWLPD